MARFKRVTSRVARKRKVIATKQEARAASARHQLECMRKSAPFRNERGDVVVEIYTHNQAHRALVRQLQKIGYPA